MIWPDNPLALLLRPAARRLAGRRRCLPTSRLGRGSATSRRCVYDPQEVVALNVANGFAVTVVFSPDERIETVTVGDSAGWQVQVNRRADAMVVKPTGYAPATNLTVMTDQRAYNFTLSTSSGAVRSILTFEIYLCEPPKQRPQAEAAPTQYQIKGAFELQPETMSDDGEFTRCVGRPRRQYRLSTAWTNPDKWRWSTGRCVTVLLSLKASTQTDFHSRQAARDYHSPGVSGTAMTTTSQPGSPFGAH